FRKVARKRRECLPPGIDHLTFVPQGQWLMFLDINGQGIRPDALYSRTPHPRRRFNEAPRLVQANEEEIATQLVAYGFVQTGRCHERQSTVLSGRQPT